MSVDENLVWHTVRHDLAALRSVARASWNAVAAGLDGSSGTSLLLMLGRYVILPMERNMATASQKILQIARRERIVRPRDVEAWGIARESLLRLYRRGVLTRTARGLYILADAAVTENHSLAVAA